MRPFQVQFLLFLHCFHQANQAIKLKTTEYGELIEFN